MNFDFTTDQYQLRDSVRRFLADRWGPKKLRAAAGKFDSNLWLGLCDLGLQTLLVPEADDGAGLSLVDVSLIFEEFGRALVPGPMVDTILASDIVARFGTSAQKKSLLPAIASGTCRVAFAHAEAGGGHTAQDVALEAINVAGDWRLQGRKILVPAAQTATIFIVSAKAGSGSAGLFICDATSEQIAIEPHRALDPDSLLCQVNFTGASAQLIGTSCGNSSLERMLETSALAAATQMVGIAAEALDIAVAYAKQRTQFDRPIGSFQAIKHKCADMLVAVESARSSVYYASWAVAEDDPVLPLAVSMAKAACGDACRLVCNDALQIHGGVGFTWDYDIHFYLKRGKLFEYAFGDASFHRERLASIVLSTPAVASIEAPSETVLAT
jgi:alkylation response protein AidB-like acyl-CoA dehydrogenase